MVQHKVALIVWGMLLPLLAGCLGGTPECTEDCDTTPPEEPEFATFDSFLFEDCVGVNGVTDVPAAFADPYVPDAFSLLGYVPGHATLGFYLDRCARVIQNDTIYEDVWILDTGAGVRSKDPSWQEVPPAGYIFELFVDDDGLARVLLEHDLPVKTASFEDTFLDAGTHHLVIQFDTGSFEFTYTVGEEPIAKGDLISHSWTGTERFLRVDVGEYEEHADLGFLQANPFIMSGESIFKSAHGSSVFYPETAQAVLHRDMSWNITGLYFE